MGLNVHHHVLLGQVGTVRAQLGGGLVGVHSDIVALPFLHPLGLVLEDIAHLSRRQRMIIDSDLVNAARKPRPHMSPTNPKRFVVLTHTVVQGSGLPLTIKTAIQVQREFIALEGHHSVVPGVRNHRSRAHAITRPSFAVTPANPIMNLVALEIQLIIVTAGRASFSNQNLCTRLQPCRHDPCADGERGQVQVRVIGNGYDVIHTIEFHRWANAALQACVWAGITAACAVVAVARVVGELGGTQGLVEMHLEARRLAVESLDLVGGERLVEDVHVVNEAAELLDGGSAAQCSGRPDEEQVVGVSHCRRGVGEGGG